MEYQEAIWEYQAYTGCQEAFMQYQEASMEYKDGLWNTTRLLWNTKKLPCNDKKPRWTTNELVWTTKKLYRISWSLIEFRIVPRGAHGIPRSCPEILEVRWNTRRLWRKTRVNSCPDSGHTKLDKKGWRMMPNQAKARRKCHETPPKR